MKDSIADVHVLADLLAIDADEAAFDWDPSALADWPNIAPAPSFTAGLPATATDRAY
jgi:hypothetical protein